MRAPTRHRGRSRYPNRSRNAGSVAAAPAPSFDPLVDVTWHSAFFAEDPDWTPPADGAAVSQWDDGSGNGRHAVQATGANQPLYRAASSVMNNKPAVEAVDTTDSLAQTAYTAIAQPFSLVFLGRLGTASAFMTDGLSAAAVNRIVFIRAASWNPNAGTGRTYGTGDGNTHLFEWIINGANAKLLIDGTQVGSTESHGTNTCVGLTLFNRYSIDTAPGNRTLSFLGIYAGNWEVDAARSSFKTWAASHYNLTIA